MTISCTADGYPRPVITWYKNGTLLLNISKFFPRDEPSIGDRFPGIMQVHSTLLIRELSTADEGDYTCRAKSEGTNETELQRPYQLTITRPSPRGTLFVYTHTLNNLEKFKTEQCFTTS